MNPRHKTINSLASPSTDVTLTWTLSTEHGLGSEEIFEDLSSFKGRSVRAVIPSPQYQQTFLKNLIAKLESFDEEVHEDILSLYMQHLANGFCGYTNSLNELGLNDVIHKRYFITDAFHPILLTESKAMILAGTTGLRTWQAR
ncbi:Protein fam86a [Entomophthora muscae]|uniref:Protein fam86a n=1 Tax=Entomophthora muscae TaxID=34485 RepID=A0ACC2SY66_9FUNG|nr:Protein fam86a [Entomophthora muscae]